jgi:hypothetical protein
MPTSRTRKTSNFRSLKSVLKMNKSKMVMKAFKVEGVIGTAFAPLLRMFFRKAFAVQSSGSVRTMPIFAVLCFGFGCAFWLLYSFSIV